ncbi:MAG: Crp/Fnr family transcriptional regulator, partial [Desulfobulbia bacterium]
MLKLPNCIDKGGQAFCILICFPGNHRGEIIVGTTREEIALTDLGFTPVETSTIISISKNLSFPKNQIILENCYLSESIYIIVEGRVGAYTHDTDGNSKLIAFYGVGDFFGGIELNDIPHITAVKTIEASRFLIIHISDLKALLPNVTTFTKKLFENLLTDVERKTLELSEIIQQKQAIAEILSTISSSPTSIRSLLETVAANAARLCDAKDAAIM